MIEVEHIIDGNKSLLTILFNKKVSEHLKVKCDDYLNFFQSQFKLNLFTLFKADTGYRITRAYKKKKMYQIQVRYPINMKEFESRFCTYYLKKNGFIKLLIK